MALASAKQMLLDASARGYAVGAFNVTSLPQMQGVIEAAVARRAPLIVQTSVTPSRLVGRHVFVAIYRSLAAAAPIPICLHLDHCTEVIYCNACAEAGYTNVMIDASQQTLDENIRLTREVSEYAHGLGDISVQPERQ